MNEKLAQYVHEKKTATTASREGIIWEINNIKPKPNMLKIKVS